MTDEATRVAGSQGHPMYRIESLADFLKVPEDRRDVCLSEFRTFLGIWEDANCLLGSGVARVSPVFYWADDGARNVSINVKFVPPGDLS